MNSQSNTVPLSHRDLAEYGVARFRDRAFDAVLSLWRRRKAEGWTQKRVAEAIGRDTGWVSRNLRAPGNWTLQTAGELVQGLNGEAEITVAALEDPMQFATNYEAHDAYDGYRAVSEASLAANAQRATGVVTSGVRIDAKQVTTEITRGGFQVQLPGARLIYEEVLR